MYVDFLEIDFLNAIGKESKIGMNCSQKNKENYYEICEKNCQLHLRSSGEGLPWWPSG